MDKLFFLSHSTQDKAIVLDIAEKLGKDNCWIYEWEVKGRDTVFKFDTGISDSKIFVLFWSKNALSSPWVKEEVDIARYRWVNERGYRPVIVLLDNTPPPISLRHRVHIGIDKGIKNIVNELISIKQDLTPQEVFYGKSILKDYFQNREELFKTLENIVASGSYGGILLLGLDGMGKTSFVKRAIAILFPDLNPIWVDLKFASTPVLLLSTFAKPFGISININEVGTNPEIFWHDIILPEIFQAKKTFIVIDNLAFTGSDHVLQNQIMTSLIQIICRDLAEIKKISNPNIILIAPFAPDFPPKTLAYYKNIHLGGLNLIHIKRALRYHLKFSSYFDYNDQKITELAEKLRGYPLAITLAANRVAEQGIDVILEDKALLQRILIDLAQDLFAGLKISDDEKQILILLATVAHPLNQRQLKFLLKDKWVVIGDIKKKQLIDPTSQDYRLHPILCDYIRSRMASSKEITDAHFNLSTLFEIEWKNSPKMSALSAQYGSMSYSHSILAGKFDDAKKIQASYLIEAKDAAIELYKNRKWSVAIKYLEFARDMSQENPDPVYDYYYALCLDRLGDTNEALKIIQNLIEKYPNTARYYHSLGLFLRKLKKSEDALASFRKAIALSKGKGKITPQVSISLLLFEMSNSYNSYLDEAEKIILSTYDLDPFDPYVVDAAVKILIKSNDVDRAVEILSKALEVNPNDPKLLHRIGLILKDMGNYPIARDYLENAANTYKPDFAVYSSLADVYLHLNDIDKAEETLEKYPGTKMNDPSYLVTKANILRLKNKLKDAEPFLEQAIRIAGNDAIPYGGMAQLKLDQAKNAISIGMKQEALIFIEEAKINLHKGLEIDPDNKGLLSIKYSFEEFSVSVGLKN